MEKQEFLDLELDDQVAYLNGLFAEGKSVADIGAELDLDKHKLGAIGIYFVRDKFMGKPMRGYRTAKRSGNEYEEAEEGGWRKDGTAKGASL
jgi:hypothetical protein